MFLPAACIKHASATIIDVESVSNSVFREVHFPNPMERINVT